MEIAGMCYVPLSFLAPFLGSVIYTVSTLLLWRGNKLPLLLMFPSGNVSHSSGITFVASLFFSSSDWWVWKENLPVCRPAPALSPQDVSACRKRVLSEPPGHEIYRADPPGGRFVLVSPTRVGPVLGTNTEKTAWIQIQSTLSNISFIRKIKGNILSYSLSLCLELWGDLCNLLSTPQSNTHLSSFLKLFWSYFWPPCFTNTIPTIVNNHFSW